MGDDAGEFGAEKPAHQVRLSSFFMGKWPVTQRLWQQVMGNYPSHFKGDRQPVEMVSWDDVQAFLDKLNGRGEVQDFVSRLGCAGMRLPTEAEWKYAARGGRWSRGFKYSGSDRLSQVGWFDRNSGNETHEVGLLLGNELGLHDMSGNVREWCSDWYSNDCYAACLQQGTCENPEGPAGGTDRVMRGGSFLSVRRSAGPSLGSTTGRCIGASTSASALRCPPKGQQEAGPHSRGQKKACAPQRQGGEGRALPCRSSKPKSGLCPRRVQSCAAAGRAGLNMA